MTGTVVTSRPGGSVAAAVWFVAALLCALPAVLTQNVHWAIFAVLPAALALTAYLSTDPPCEFEVTREGLSFHAPTHDFVRYEDIHGLTAPGNRTRQSFPMQLYHRGGVVRIPARLDVPSWELYDFILKQLPPAGSTDPAHVPSGLRAFLTDQLALFGPEKVFVYRARPYAPLGSQTRAVRYSLACAAAGGVWVALGVGLKSALDRKEGESMAVWIGLGVLFLLLGVLFALLFNARSRGAGRVKDWQNSCLVVSPGGIALLQGVLKGKLRWDELRAIEYPARRRFALATAGGVKNGIGLLVEGAYLVIADYYDRPLSTIEEQLRAYWGGRDAN